MERSIELNDELHRNTEEINDEIPKGNLPTELKTMKLPILELQPQPSLNFKLGHFSSVFCH